MIDERAAELLSEIDESVKRFKALQRVIPNPKTLSSKLRKLIALGLLEKEEGVYHLTSKGRKALLYVQELQRILRPQPTISVERIPHRFFRPYLKRFAVKLLDRHEDDLTGVLLFGSVARGDWNKDSDIDLLIVLREFESSRIETLRELTALRAELRESSEYKECVSKGYFPIVQVYPLEREEAKRFRRMYLDALTEGIIIFERDSFLRDLISAFKERLRELGAKRIDIPSVGHYWVLGDLKAGEVLEL
ncbi:MAG: nucleotidyltransferase domain-containing protein [Thermoplasmata archaeon]